MSNAAKAASAYHGKNDASPGSGSVMTYEWDEIGGVGRQEADYGTGLFDEGINAHVKLTY